MPLKKSPSKAAFVSNLKAELASGRKKSQALAIAYSVKRQAGMSHARQSHHGVKKK